MYGKLENEILTYAPTVLKIDNKIHYHPSSSLYEELGYLPIINTTYPIQGEGEEQKYYASTWEVKDNKIVKVWAETEPPIEEPVVTSPSIDERVSELENRLAGAEENITNVELALTEIYER